MREVVIAAFARTAFAIRGGALRSFSDVALGAECLKGLVRKSGILERGGTGAVDAVFAGSALGSRETVTPARYMSLLAGFPNGMESHQVAMQDGSAVAAINHAAAQIALGYADVAIAGGMESYSTQPVFLSAVTEPYQGLAPAWLDLRMVPADEQNVSRREVSDLMAERWGVSRAQCDAFALRSRERLEAARASGLVGGEIVTVVVPGTRKTPDLPVHEDAVPPLPAGPEGLAGLRPFRADGVSTEGNFACLSDGAGFVLMMSAERAGALGYEPYARWVAGADVGVEPRYMGIGPAFAGLKALKLAGLSIRDVGVWECNELSAAQNLSVIRELEDRTGAAVDQSRWNPNGGALALGDPNSASGARIAMFAMEQLEKSGGRYGVFSACCAGGQGVAAVIENLRR